METQLTSSLRAAKAPRVVQQGSAVIGQRIETTTLKNNTTSHRGPLARARFTTLRNIAIAGLLLGAAGTATSRADILYGTNQNTNAVGKITSAGTSTVFVNTGFVITLGMAFDSAGNLFVGDRAGTTIKKFTPGGVGTLFADNASAGVGNPFGLAFDGAGNLFVGNVGNDTITRYTPGGVGSIFANNAGNVSVPIGLAFDTAGSLYVAQQNSGVYKFTAGGVGTPFGAGAANEYLAFTTDAGVPLPLANQTPEPTSVALAGFGALALLSRARRRKT